MPGTRTILTIESSLTAVLHGTSLNKVRNRQELHRRTAEEVLQEIDPVTTIRRSEVSLFQDVYDYSTPSDLKGDKIIDIRPQANRSRADNFNHNYLEQFDLYKADRDWTVENRDTTTVLRIVRNLGRSVAVNGMNSLTANGTWAAVSGGSTIALNSLFFIDGGGSIQFNVGATGGSIENSTMTRVDLSDHEDTGTMFLWAYLPSVSNVTDIRLRWGSDSSNYFSRTSTTPHFGSAFVTGWNLISFAWNGATETGTVDVDNIDYLLVTVTTTVAKTGIRIDKIFSSLPQIHEVLYYSKFLFRSSGGTFLEFPTSATDNDLLNLDTDSYPVYFNKLGMLVSQQTQGSDMVSDFNFFKAGYDQALRKYKAKYPSETESKSSSYYHVRR